MTRTNPITGFLGGGKTTSVLHLLAQKPVDEKWVILVNEFSEVGIDGALLADSGALFKEILGGYMCCVNDLPVQVGPDTLLRQGKSDRLLIESIGLGHPKQILDILTAAVYEPWIDLRATACILDPRQLLDEEVANSGNFRDQLAAADVIVTSKNDRETPESAHTLADWWQRWGGDRRKMSATQDSIDLALLDEPCRSTAPLSASAEHVHHSRPTGGLAVLSLPEHQRWHRHLNSSQGYRTCSWIFGAETVSETIGLPERARLTPVARVEGVMRIAKGAVKISRQGEDQHIETLGAFPLDNQIELTSADGADWNALQTSLLKPCLS